MCEIVSLDKNDKQDKQHCFALLLPKLHGHSRDDRSQAKALTGLRTSFRDLKLEADVDSAKIQRRAAIDPSHFVPAG